MVFFNDPCPPMGEINVKGYGRPQAAYNVLRLKGHVPG